MYDIGDLLVYGGSSSVCKVSDIADFDFQGNGEKKQYYVLKPLRENCVIYNPVDNTGVFMRPVISRDEAEKLIDMIPELDVSDVGTEASDMHEAKLLAQHYESMIKSRDCKTLVKLTKSIYEKKQQMAKKNRDIGSVESSSMKRAEKALFEELSVALDIPCDGVPKYIKARLVAKLEKLEKKPRNLQ